jgi:GntR family transcriptional regulator
VGAPGHHPPAEPTSSYSTSVRTQADKGIVDRFSSIGHHVNQVEKRLDIRTPTVEEAKLLDIVSNRPVVQITQTFRVCERLGAENDYAVETADILFPTDRYELRYVMEVH